MSSLGAPLSSRQRLSRLWGSLRGCVNSVRRNAIAEHFRTSVAINRGPECAEETNVTNSSALPGNEDGERVALDSTPVVLLLDACRISATVYLAPELGRFSEAWESVMNDHRLFIPVTNAVVTTLAGETVGERSAFMQVRKTDIRAVSPLDYSR
jgi:hypothetical protein